MRIARVDRNQKEIVDAFRKLGCSVVHLHTVGHGCPDICIGKNGINILVEIKDYAQPESKQKLTEDEKKFHESWRGDIRVISTVEQAAQLISLLSTDYLIRKEERENGK